MYYINTVVSYQEKMSVLHYCKLNSLGHINITSIMKRRNGWGEREGSQLISSCAQPGNFLYFLRTFRKFSGNSVIVPSPDRKRFPPWTYAKLPYRAWENCSAQCKGLFQAQKRKITMTSKENRNFCHSVPAVDISISNKPCVHVWPMVCWNSILINCSWDMSA
jgi:hypothetical protein